MALFKKAELKVRLKEEVGFAGPIFCTVQVKGGDYSRFFWTKLKGTSEMQPEEAYEVAINFCLKHKARFI